MFQHINSILQEFRICFKREKTWQWFVMLVLGFMLRSSKRVVTQVISVLRLRPDLYHTMLYFFRSTTYSVDEIYEKWVGLACKHGKFLQVSGRTVLLGDHVKISKEGRRMPGIEILHQDSQNSGKGEFIEGHIHAHVSALIQGSGTTRSLPLMTQRQQSPPKDKETKKSTGATLTTQMVKLIGKVVRFLSCDSKVVAVLDAYFAKASTFEAANKVLTSSGETRLAIVTRGRDDTVGYNPAPLRQKGQRGRPRKYGDAVRLSSLFSHMKNFTQTNLILYGKSTVVKYQCIDLIWKPLGTTIRFVVVETYRGRMILMCSDITLRPEDIIIMYCLRFKIETSFDEQKNDNGGFSYRFWTKALAKRKKWVKNINHDDVVGSASHVEDAKRAIESFLCLSVIASGIMTIIAFSYNRQIWSRYTGWIRTRRSDVPSIAIVKDVLQQDFLPFTLAFPELSISSIVLFRQRVMLFLFQDLACGRAEIF